MIDDCLPLRPDDAAAPSSDDLDALERELGASVPAGARALLMRWGGVELMREPHVALPRPFRGDETASVAGILGWEGDVLISERQLVPPELLPIARDPGTDLFCVRLADGAVVLVAHDDADAPVVVASSVAAFLDALAPTPAPSA